MIELRNVSIGFVQKLLLDNVYIEFSSGRLTALIGRNGSGKSTLLKAISGINEKFTGEILIEDTDIRKIPKHRLAKKLAFVNTQRPRMARLKCFDVVALGRSPHTGWNGKLSAIDKQMAEEALQLIGMPEYSHRYFNSLSDGESQKIMIARAIAQETDIIILDEPTSFLDLPTRHEMASLLRSLCHDHGKTIIFSTHELDIAR